MGFRHCVSSLPRHLTELPQGPRQGTVSRQGFEPAWDAAGNAFPEGEHDRRLVMTVGTLPRKRQDASKSDFTCAAGYGSPRVNDSTPDIEDCVRRARSEPPQMQSSRAVQCTSMHALGIPPAIDLGLCGRRHAVSPRLLLTSRQQDAESAMSYGDIAGVMVKRHFLGNHSPRETLSSRLADRPLESIDIDSHAGRARPSATMPCKGVTPQSSHCFSLACEVNGGSWRNAPRCRSFDFFEKKMQSEHYAKLIGRLHEETDKELNQTRLGIEVKRRHRKWLSHTALTEDADGEQSQVVEIKQRRLSSKSTTASEGSISSSSENLIAFSKATRAVCKHGRKNDAEQPKECEQPHSMPLGFRRVISSLVPAEQYVVVARALAARLEPRKEVGKCGLTERMTT